MLILGYFQGVDPRREDFPNHLFVEAFHHELKRAHDASWIIYTETQVEFLFALLMKHTTKYVRK